MGTRGALGFRFKEVDKVTYCHFDSYPTGVGVDVITTIHHHNDEELAGAANRITLVDEQAKPTPAQIKRYRKFANSEVSTGQFDEWYVLLREVQGSLEPYIDGRIDHMIDSRAFLNDSLFCEWAYVINCDERTLEVYKGFNPDPGAPGRYAAAHRERPGEYNGVALLATISLDEVRSKWAPLDLAQHLETLGDGDE